MLRLVQCRNGDLLGRGAPGWRRTLELAYSDLGSVRMVDLLRIGNQGEKNSRVQVA